jgi:hypothetical protein
VAVLHVFGCVRAGELAEMAGGALRSAVGDHILKRRPSFHGSVFSKLVMAITASSPERSVDTLLGIMDLFGEAKCLFMATSAR